VKHLSSSEKPGLIEKKEDDKEEAPRGRQISIFLQKNQENLRIIPRGGRIKKSFEKEGLYQIGLFVVSI